MERCLTPTLTQMKQLNKRRKVYFRQKNSRDFRIGDPRYMTIYDNGGTDKDGGTIDRYTVVFTRSLGEKSDSYYFYLGMNESPFYAQGFGQHGESRFRIDKPTYKHLGKRIRFSQMPTDCQKAALQDYIQLYDLCICEG